jgi:hypothetical protein
VTERASGHPFAFETQYLIACDGVGSSIRRVLGLTFDGNPALSFSVNILIRLQDFLASHDKGKAKRYLVIGPNGVCSNFTCINGQDLWRFTIVDHDQKLDSTKLDVHAAIRRAFGREDVSFEVISAQPWRRSACTAGRFRAGRVFLAGDPVHSMSSTGGYGMNTGMGDAIDLSWKLDAVMRGWGGPHLLDSYEAERKPIALRNIAASTSNFNVWKSSREEWKHLCDDTREGADVRQSLFNHLTTEWISTGIALGYRYEGSPLIIPDGSPPPFDSHSEYHQTARPGHRAPHAYLSDGRSTSDLFGRGYVLLRLGLSPPDVSPLAEAAAVRGVPLIVVDLLDPNIGALYERRLALVRPDGHTAWRADTVSNAPVIIDRIRGASPPLRA